MTQRRNCFCIAIRQTSHQAQGETFFLSNHLTLSASYVTMFLYICTVSTVYPAYKIDCFLSCTTFGENDWPLLLSKGCLILKSIFNFVSFFTNISFTSCEQPIFETQIFVYILFDYFYQVKVLNINNLYLHFLMYFHLNSKPGKVYSKHR